MDKKVQGMLVWLDLKEKKAVLIIWAFMMDKSQNKEGSPWLMQMALFLHGKGGSGTGKTKWSWPHRTTGPAYQLIDECGVKSWNIMAITFTNKAAGEIPGTCGWPGCLSRRKYMGIASVFILPVCADPRCRHIESLGYMSPVFIYDSDDQKTLDKVSV